MRKWSVLTLAALTALAQAPPTVPVAFPRGVVNAFTQQPAPSLAAPGGLIWITGLNLGPPEGLTAAAAWPTKLGDMEVLINGRAAPIGSVSPGRIVAQVPWETAQGVAQAVVRRGESSSRPARFIVANPLPSLRAAGDRGFGEPAGQSTMLQGSGFGVTEPRAGSGETAPGPGMETRANLRAFVGGLSVPVVATLSSQRVGEFDVKIEAPAEASPGDLITVVAGNRPANRLSLGKMARAQVLHMRLPQGVPELRTIITSDLRGSYVLANAARDANGCYASWLIDVAASSAAEADACLTASGVNAPTPVAAMNEAVALAALVGPPAGTQGPVSSKLKIWNPGKSPLTVELPEPAVSVGSSQNGNPTAILGSVATGLRVVEVDAVSGELSEPLAGGQGGGGGAGLMILGGGIDLGDGVTSIVAPPTVVAQLGTLIVATDSLDTPSKAKVGVVNNRGEITATRDFPAGWLPLLAPAPQAGPGAPGQPGGPGGPGPGAAAVRFRGTTYFDAPTRTYFVLARRSDSTADAMLAFPADGSPAKTIEVPAGTFIASCTPNIPVFNLELSRRVALFGDTVAGDRVSNPCSAQSFVLLDPGAQTVSVIPLQGQGQANAAGNFGDINDFIFAANTDPARRGTADTLFVLDSVDGSTFRFDLPPEVAGFAQLNPIPSLSLLIGTANNRQAGDAGFVVFDLDTAQTRVLPTPEGFANVQLAGVFPATRKLVARGNRPAGAGSQYLIYDLVTGDLQMPPNPEDVAFVGGLPQQAQQMPQPQQPPGVQQRANPKANTVTAITYNSDRRQSGILVLRIP